MTDVPFPDHYMGGDDNDLLCDKCRNEEHAPLQFLMEDWQCSCCGRTWTPLRILVTGSRRWTDVKLLEQTLDGVLGDWPAIKTTLIHGGAEGADTMAEKWANENGLWIERHAASWKLYGKAAGPIRNSEMVNSHPNVCVAFLMEGSRGTRDCLSKAQRAGIETVEVNR